MRPSIEERFLDKVLPEPNSGCWLWDGAAWKNYGVIYGEGRYWVATHLSMRLHGRHADSDDAICCHHCDVRLCVNPDHLYWGTQSDNVQDSYDRQRRVSPPAGRVGERNTNVKLTEADVRDILSSPVKSPALANRYGVAHSTIRRIRRREIWGHLME